MLKAIARKSLTFARRPILVTKTNLFMPLCQKIGKPKNYLRCSFLCRQPWNAQFVRSYGRARRFHSEVDPGVVGVIRVLSYSRSGSHNFLSRLHYLRSCFVLKENLCPDRYDDPMWLSMKPDDITAADYMGFSLFGAHGLQQKQGDELSHLVLPSNRLLEFPLVQQGDPFRKEDKIVLLVRNFFRVLMSRQNVVRKRGRAKWMINDDVFYRSINAHHANIRKYRALMTEDPARFQVLGHEVYCARPRDVFRATAERLGIADPTWISPRDFFVESFDGKTAPVVDGGRLWDTSVEQPILGTGGGYNPMTTPSLERTLSDDVAQFVKKQWVEHAERLFGRRLVGLWLSDTPGTYETMSTEEYTGLLMECNDQPVARDTVSEPRVYVSRTAGQG